MSVHSTAKEWKRFLTEAGLPKELAGHYAEIFSHHRMRMSMLPDLNKDILFFMGIEVMGDVIAILKHAKQVSVTLGYSKDYESSKLHTSTKQHKRERTPQHHSSSRQYSSSHGRKASLELDSSPQARRPSKPNQEYSSFQNFSRNEKQRKFSPEINVTFNNSGRDKFYRASDANESRGLSRYQAPNQAYTGTYRDRGVRSRSRSRSPIYSGRLHMDESPAKISVRSRISSRADLRKQKLSPITFSNPHRATSHASSAKHSLYRNNRNSEANDYNDYSRRDGRMYADIEERQQQQQQQQQQRQQQQQQQQQRKQQQQSRLTKASYVNELMPSLTIHVDNRGRNKREIHQQDSAKWPRNDSWQHDDRKSRDTVRYDRNQSPAKSNYTQHRFSPKSYETKSRHVSVFNRLT